MKEITQRARWIWARDNTVKNDQVVFRRRFILQAPPKEALAFIGADTRYWLYVNGTLVVAEGGLFRESMPGCGYADGVELAPFLQSGENTLAIFCWYYGNEGRNNNDSGQAGFFFQCEALDLFSDESFLCRRHPAYYETGEPLPAYLFGGHNIGFDARKDIGDFTLPDFEEKGFTPAAVYPNTVWGSLYLRPIPLFHFSKIQFCPANAEASGSKLYPLPYAMHFFPVIRCRAKGGEKIDLRSDRYEVHGGPGGETDIYRGHRTEYICKPGENAFESPGLLFGEAILAHCSPGVEELQIGWRESGYGCDLTGSFICDCPVTNKLVQKAKRTLYVCMRDNFMDCPDRERGQWIGDVSVQAPQVFFALGHSAVPLLKKAIHNFIHLRKGDVLVGNVPGIHFWELPSQSLNAISEWGLLAQYYHYTEDKSVLADAFLPAVKYLQLWETDADALVLPRKGDWRWFDHLYNIDDAVLENAWYYSALRFAAKMAEILDIHEHDGFLQGRMAGMEESFDKRFWKEHYYSGGSVIDDRANAMAVLAGLCKKENYEKVMKILLSVNNATVYMENYVLTALCEMGYLQEAYRRMVSRYYNLAQNENTTLWEDFNILGTKNHAWSGAPLTVAFKYFLGIDTADGFQSFTVRPAKELFEKMEGTFSLGEGTVTLRIDNKTGQAEVINTSGRPHKLIY